MNSELRKEIKNRFPHINFSSDEDMERWFFETLLPFVVLKWMGAVETHEDGSGSFDRRTFNAIKEDFNNWKEGA